MQVILYKKEQEVASADICKSNLSTFSIGLFPLSSTWIFPKWLWQSTATEVSSQIVTVCFVPVSKPKFSLVAIFFCDFQVKIVNIHEFYLDIIAVGTKINV